MFYRSAVQIGNAAVLEDLAQCLDVVRLGFYQLVHCSSLQSVAKVF